MSPFAKGMVVVHPKYGRGTVTSVRCNGAEVHVSFGSFSLWIPGRDLEPTGTGLRLLGPDGKEVRPASVRTERKPLEAILRLLQGGTGAQHDAPAPDASPADAIVAPAVPKRRPRAEPVFRPARTNRPVEDATVLESFRLGIVPTAQVEQWTVGRDGEIARIREWLRDHAEGALLVEGAYGSGKSHLLQYLARDAEIQGYAVAQAGFDPSEATAAFPKKAFKRLVQGFSAVLGGEEIGFRGFLEAVAMSPRWPDVLGDHWLLAPFLAKVAAGSATDDDWDWVEARGRGDDSHPTLHDYSTCANLYCNLLSALGRAAVEVLDLAGLVLLMDEAEVARNVMYRYQALRGLNFFRGLVWTANDEPALLDEAVAREGNVTLGAESRLVYSGHNPVRFSSGIPSHLKVAFALTPGSLQTEFRRSRESIPTIELDVLSTDQLQDLFNRICDRFGSVTGIAVGVRDRLRLFRSVSTADRVTSTRMFIKATVEVLDYLRFFPAGDVDRLVANGGEW